MTKYILFLYSIITCTLFLTLSNCIFTKQPTNEPINTTTGGINSNSTSTNSVNATHYTPLINTQSSHNDDYYDDDQRGASAKLITEDYPEEDEVFTDFRLGKSSNSIDDLKVHVDLKKTKKHNYWAGSVTITFSDHGDNNTNRSVTTFKSGKKDDAKYNIWSKDFADCELNLRTKKNKTGNEQCFHGFFQHKTSGSLILVIDDNSLGSDGAESSSKSLVSGSVWVMQFRATFKKGHNSCNTDEKFITDHNNSPGNIDTLSLNGDKKCWFIPRGTFDCRTWRKGKGVNTLLALEPNGSCYKKLGEFNGLNVLKAFNVSRTTRLKTKEEKE